MNWYIGIKQNIYDFAIIKKENIEFDEFNKLANYIVKTTNKHKNIKSLSKKFPLLVLSIKTDNQYRKII